MIAPSRDSFAGVLVGLILPAAQSLITGLFLFLFMWPISSVAWEYAVYNRIPMVGTPVLFAVACGSGVAFMMWVHLRSRWHDALEQLLNVDLNNDGTIGGDPDAYAGEEYSDDPEPLPPEEVVTHQKKVKVFVHQDNQTKIFNVPVEYEVLIKVAKLLLQRRVFNYGDFSGPGKLLKRADFELLRQELIARGILLRAEGKSSPPTLTRVGKATLEALVRDSEGSSLPS